jgi:VIT1/CCC1 family predicted Fe2+/Mn2+ transporter
MQLITWREAIRNSVLGCEDGVVSTTGLLCALHLAGDMSATKIYRTALVTVVIQALSMALGAYMAASTSSRVPESSSVAGAAATFAAYMLSSACIYAAFSIHPAIRLPASIVTAAIILFVVAYLTDRQGSRTTEHRIQKAIQVSFLAMCAVFAGLAIGSA